MRLILNVIWLIFGGLWLALGYLLAALICFVLIITIPFGFAALRIASYALWPFGRTIVDKPGARPGALIGNVIWVILFGIWLAIGHVVTAVGDGDHDHRHPAGAGQPETDPGVAVAAGQGDRARRLSALVTCRVPHDRHRLGVPSVRPRRPVGADADRRARCVDTFGRVATDLRVSLTDRCNLRCTYCMPAEGLDWLPGEQLLQPDELTRLLRIAVTRLGITSVRFTGGEPLVAKHLEEVVAAAAALRPRPEIALTTNGIGLARRAAALKRGRAWTGSTSRWTPSTPTHFAAITRRDRLADVLAGSGRRSAAGLTPVKVNAVLDPATGPRRRRRAAAVLPRARLPAAHHRADAAGRRPRVAPRRRPSTADDVLAALRRHFDADGPTRRRAVRRPPSSGWSTAGPATRSASSRRCRTRSARPVTAPG